MRDYKQVVEERYNSEDPKKNRAYSCMTKKGRLGKLTWICILSDFIKYVTKQTKKEYTELSICDCGCGTGNVTRIIVDLVENSQNVCGFEFSQKSLNECKSLNNSIEYKHGDLVEAIPDFECSTVFDGMIASTVFMHLRKKEDVMAGLLNIKNKLADNGVFMWYEANADTHYAEDEEDGRGFSRKEMEEHAKEAGFKLVKSMGINPILPIVGDIYYGGKKIPEGVKLFLQYHNKPFKCLNNIMWFMKE